MWHRHAFERPADGRSVEGFGRLNIARVEFMPTEISVGHSFLLVAAVYLTENYLRQSTAPYSSSPRSEAVNPQAISLPHFRLI